MCDGVARRAVLPDLRGAVALQEGGRSVDLVGSFAVHIHLGFGRVVGNVVKVSSAVGSGHRRRDVVRCQPRRGLRSLLACRADFLFSEKPVCGHFSLTL